MNAEDFLASNPSELALSERGSFTYIFTIPSLTSGKRNCTGTAVAIEFCFMTRNSDYSPGDTRSVLVLYHLNHKTDGFIATSRYFVSYSNGIMDCSPPMDMADQEYVCCRVQTLPANRQFSLTSKEFTFGIGVLFTSLLAFTTSKMEYQAQQYRVRTGFPLPLKVPTNNIINVTEPSQSRPLPLFRLLIGRYDICCKVI